MYTRAVRAGPVTKVILDPSCRGIDEDGDAAVAACRRNYTPALPLARSESVSPLILRGRRLGRSLVPVQNFGAVLAPRLILATMGSAPAQRRKAGACVAVLCLLAVYVSHTSRVEQWIHREFAGKVDTQHIGFLEIFYEALAQQQRQKATVAAPAAADAQPDLLGELRDEVAREQKSLDSYLVMQQGLPVIAADSAADDEVVASHGGSVAAPSAVVNTEEQRKREAASACSPEQHRIGVDLVGGNSGGGGAVSSGHRTPQACCEHCYDNRGRAGNIHCKAWTFDGPSGKCFLKNEPRGEEPAGEGVVSGYIPVSSRQTCPSAAERDYAQLKFGAGIAEREKTSSARGVDGGGIAWPHTDLVLVTAWGRPEFLLATLEHLIRAQGVDEHKFLFLLDDEFDLRMLCIIDAWPRHRGKIIIRTPRHDWMWTKSWGNTYNTLEGYRYAQMMALGSHAKKRGEKALSTAELPVRKNDEFYI